MKQFLQIALGILSAIGGFVDIGDLVFNTQAGATFGFVLPREATDSTASAHPPAANGEGHA